VLLPKNPDLQGQKTTVIRKGNWSMPATQRHPHTLNDEVGANRSDLGEVQAFLTALTAGSGERASAEAATHRLESRLAILKNKSTLFQHITLSEHARELLKQAKND
jgi:hypothetical protein